MAEQHKKYDFGNDLEEIKKLKDIVMSLQSPYRIIHCTKYNDKRLLEYEWWEVQSFKSKWWSFGKKWFMERGSFWGDFDILRFSSEKEAFEYIGRVSTNVPKRTTVRTPVTSFI
jgi:hypothetical protein